MDVRCYCHIRNHHSLLRLSSTILKSVRTRNQEACDCPQRDWPRWIPHYELVHIRLLLAVLSWPEAEPRWQLHTQNPAVVVLRTGLPPRTTSPLWTCFLQDHLVQVQTNLLQEEEGIQHRLENSRTRRRESCHCWRRIWGRVPCTRTNEHAN